MCIKTGIKKKQNNFKNQTKKPQTNKQKYQPKKPQPTADM